MFRRICFQTVYDNGVNYIDLIAIRHHMRRVGTSGRFQTERFEGVGIAFFSSAVGNPVSGRLEFAHNPTETDAIASAPCAHCKQKVRIPVGTPLLQASAQCGARRRNSLDNEGSQRGNDNVEYDLELSSSSWIPRPIAPIHVEEDSPMLHPPVIAPHLLDNREDVVASYREATPRRWPHAGQGSYPSVVFNRRGILAPELTKCDAGYLQWVDYDCAIGNIWKESHLGDHLYKISGEVRISARHIQNLNLLKRDTDLEFLRNLAFVDHTSVGKVIDYHTRCVIPVYRGAEHPVPRVRGYPYKKRQSYDISSKLRNDVKNGRMLACITKSVTEYDKIICAPNTRVTKKMPGRALSAEMRLIFDVRLIGNFCDKHDYPDFPNPAIQDIDTRVECVCRNFADALRRVAKRDVNDSPGRVKTHHYCVSILRAEFHGGELGLPRDIGFLWHPPYLPAHFARVLPSVCAPDHDAPLPTKTSPPNRRTLDFIVTYFR